jgi:hypothetical protein
MPGETDTPEMYGYRCALRALDRLLELYKRLELLQEKQRQQSEAELLLAEYAKRTGR